jgi:ribosomal protein S18 acetylase RimI-like enzyme
MKPKDVSIRPYTPADEVQWVRCRVLAFLDSAYFDDVERSKPQYGHPAIELVAEHPSGTIVGFMDVECEEAPGTVCSGRPGLGGMIWNIGVHPDYRRRGIASDLLTRAIELGRRRELVRLEAWTRDDPPVLAWYRSQGFHLVDRYLHVYLDAREAKASFSSRIADLVPIRVYAHYGEQCEFESIRSQFTRVHDCQLFELNLEADKRVAGAKSG